MSEAEVIELFGMGEDKADIPPPSLSSPPQQAPATKVKTKDDNKAVMYGGWIFGAVNLTLLIVFAIIATGAFSG